MKKTKAKSKTKSFPKGLEEYKEYVRKRLSELTPVMQKAAVGDFSSEVEIPKKEDEFSELYVGLNLMMEDLRELETARERNEVERRRTGEERQKRLAELERWRSITTGREMKMVELKKEVERLEEELKTLKKRTGEAIE